MITELPGDLPSQLAKRRSNRCHEEDLTAVVNREQSRSINIVITRKGLLCICC
jgi:hypothetical protein